MPQTLTRTHTGQIDFTSVLQAYATTDSGELALPMCPRQCEPPSYAPCVASLVPSHPTVTRYLRLSCARRSVPAQRLQLTCESRALEFGIDDLCGWTRLVSTAKSVQCRALGWRHKVEQQGVRLVRKSSVRGAAYPQRPRRDRPRTVLTEL